MARVARRGFSPVLRRDPPGFHAHWTHSWLLHALALRGGDPPLRPRGDELAVPAAALLSLRDLLASSGEDELAAIGDVPPPVQDLGLHLQGKRP